VARLWYPSGHVVPPHRHPHTERVRVLSGMLFLGFGAVFDVAGLRAIPAGEVFVMPRDTPHFVLVKEDTVIEVAAEGPWSIEYVLDADDPRAHLR
jgi:quercetin dioxygenase-like cupin family protein